MDELHNRQTPPNPLCLRRPLRQVLCVVLALKLVLVVVDPTPLFFMGDSGVHIHTALDGYVPLERSHVYGLLIRVLAVWPGTLTTLVLAQSLAGAATAWLVAFVLIRVFGSRPTVALGAAVVCCLDPLLVIHERLVLTEAFSQLLLATHLTALLWYLRRPDGLLLVVAAIAGILLVSLRTVHVPVVLCNAGLAPLLAAAFPSDSTPRAARAKQAAAHLGLSLVATFLLHAMYREWMGELTDRLPDYQYETGFFQAAAWAPILRPEDATDLRAADVIRDLDASPWRLDDRGLRGRHRWGDEGLVQRLRQAYGGDLTAADQACREMCSQALRRDPVAVARLAGLNYRDYIDVLSGDTQYTLRAEQGDGGQLPKEFLDTTQRAFGLDASDIPNMATPSKQYHLAGTPWYLFLLVSPLAGVVSVVVCRRYARGGAVLLALNSMMLLAVVCVMASVASCRYLCPLSFPAILALGIIADSACRRLGGLRAGGKSPLQVVTSPANQPQAEQRGEKGRGKS